MNKNQNDKLLVINSDICPKTDEPIIADQCIDVCPFYACSQNYNGLNCIKCSNF